MKPYTYLFIDLGCILVPFLASFYPKQAFYKEWKYFFPVNILVATAFLIWDYIFTAQGVWGFNPDYLTGFYIGNLPIEEVLFFICIPYACTFTYFAFRYLIQNNPLVRFQKQITQVLWLAMFGLGLTFLNQKYTAITFLSTAAFLAYCYQQKLDLSYVYLAYLAILPFFFMSNGLLTGSYLAEPIVWYNDEENFGIRMFTIPVEDTFYGFLLVALNIVGYRKLARKEV